MKSIMAGALTMLALATTTAGAAEVDHYNANNMLVYCKAFIGEGKAKNAIAASYCNGMIDMLAIMSSWLDKYPDVCIEFPKDVTTQQASHRPVHRGAPGEDAR